MKSHTDIDIGGLTGQEKEASTWAAGGRIGLLVTLRFLPYTSVGYTQAHFDQVNLGGPGGPGFINSQTYNGYFIGTVFEYAFDFLPGLFLKNEYRFSSYDSATLPIVATGGGTIATLTSSKYIQTFSTELVYRFNWFR